MGLSFPAGRRLTTSDGGGAPERGHPHAATPPSNQAEPWSREEAMSSVLSSPGRHHLALSLPLYPPPGHHLALSLPPYPPPGGPPGCGPVAALRRRATAPAHGGLGVGRGDELGGDFRAASHLLGWPPEATLSPCGLLGALPSAPRDLPASPPPLPMESQTGESAVTCHRRDPPNLRVWLRAAETSRGGGERERESHPPWKQNLLFSIHPRTQLKHVTGLIHCQIVDAV